MRICAGRLKTKIFTMSFPNKLNILFNGETGVGKTSCITSMALNDGFCHICVNNRNDKTLEQIFSSERFENALDNMQKQYGKDNVKIWIDELHVTAEESKDLVAKLNYFTILHPPKN